MYFFDLENIHSFTIMESTNEGRINGESKYEIPLYAFNSNIKIMGVFTAFMCTLVYAIKGKEDKIKLISK